MKNKNLTGKFQCCFCGKAVKPKAPDVGAMLYTTNFTASPKKQHSQQFFCHAACLKKLLHPSAKLYVLDLSD